MHDHPELDMLELLMEVSSDEDADEVTSLLKGERKRKRKERNKRKMLEFALSSSIRVTNTPQFRRQTPNIPIELLEVQVKREALIGAQ